MSPFPPPWGNYLIQGIVETVVPDGVSVWPQTLGWQLVFFCVFLYLMRQLYLTFRSYQRNAYRRHALAWLTSLPEYTDLAVQPMFRELPVLIRTTAMKGFGRTAISGLSAAKWSSWLDQQCEKTSFADLCASSLHDLAYAPELQMNQQQMCCLLDQVTLWIKFHRRPDD